jgi:hypothetical protein
MSERSKPADGKFHEDTDRFFTESVAEDVKQILNPGERKARKLRYNLDQLKRDMADLKQQKLAVDKRESWVYAAQHDLDSLQPSRKAGKETENKAVEEIQPPQWLPAGA